MKRLIFLILFLSFIAVHLNAQEQTTTIKGYVVPICVYKGDTIPSMRMPTLYVYKDLYF